jgi:hypothetical protein
MTPRKVANRDEAVRFLNQADVSGLPRATWARQNGIDARSLNLWRVILNRKDRVPSNLRLVELIPHASDSARTGVRVRRGELVVEVDADFDEQALARVLAVVARC